MPASIKLLSLCLMSASLFACGTNAPRVLESHLTPAQYATVKRADSQMKDVLNALVELNPKPIETLTAAQARRQPNAADATFQLMQEKGTAAPKPLPAVGRVELTSIISEAGPIPLKVFTPKGDGPFPVIVYYHGGGWVLADTQTYEASIRALSEMTKAVVISVEYRRAPEFKFPAAHQDSYAALQYVMTHAEQFSGDPTRVAVAGESAGGNLATAVCRMASMRGGRMPIHQLLIYPITNYFFDTPSYRENADAKPLNAQMMTWFFRQYLNSPADGDNLLVSPLRASLDDLKRLPPATVITSEIDPLRSEGEAYADKLRSAGVDVALKNYEGVTHEFFGMGLLLDTAKDAEKFAASRLNRTFEGRPGARSERAALQVTR